MRREATRAIDFIYWDTPDALEKEERNEGGVSKRRKEKKENASCEQRMHQKGIRVNVHLNRVRHHGTVETSGREENRSRCKMEEWERQKGKNKRGAVEEKKSVGIILLL